MLSLPVASTGERIESLDALFTATSAVCVTGLTVIDVGQRLSWFGQTVLLILIQLGGLGIMTFATGLLLSIGSGLSFQHKFALSEALGGGSGVRSGTLIKAVLWTTAIVELAGAIALFTRLKGDLPIGRAVFVSVFHSVSAFCNAGFSLYSNSLESFRSDTPTLIIFSILIISGGFGFIVIREVFTSATRRRRGLSLHTRLCLTMTAVLLVAGTVGFYTAELSHTAAGGAGLDLPNAFFQAVTCRTAGFNTVPMAGLTELSILIAMILMFIGACPGSTGGGIKATTVAIILLLVYQRFRGKQSVTAFKRTISNDSLVRAVAVVLLAIIVIVAIFSLFMFTEEKALSHTLSHGWFVDNLFEVVSALATVGLSLGVTPHVHEAGKSLLIILMFVGRVGLLTLAFALSAPRKRGEVVYREEEVMVG